MYKRKILNTRIVEKVHKKGTEVKNSMGALEKIGGIFGMSKKFNCSTCHENFHTEKQLLEHKKKTHA